MLSANMIMRGRTAMRLRIDEHSSRANGDSEIIFIVCNAEDVHDSAHSDRAECFRALLGKNVSQPNPLGSLPSRSDRWLRWPRRGGDRSALCGLVPGTREALPQVPDADGCVRSS